MNDEQVSALFRTVGDHLESLAIRIQKAQDLHKQDPAQQETNQAQLDCIERMLRLRVRQGNQERKKFRARLNALIESQMSRGTKLAVPPAERES